MMKRTSLAILLSVILIPAYAENKIIINVIKKASPSIVNSLGKPNINASQYQLMEIDIDTLREQLKTVGNKKYITQTDTWLKLPNLEGKNELVRVTENTTMSPGLAAKFPDIRAYNGYGDHDVFVKLDVTPKGFHAMIMEPGKQTVFIDPYSNSTDRYYIVYSQDKFITNKKAFCEVSGTSSQQISYPSIYKSTVPFTNCQLKKYRLALAATTQYTQFTGGTKQTALAAQVTTMNRVNGIYETDAGVTMELIANNADVICDYNNCPSSPPGPAGVQPYTSGNTAQLLAQNQTNVDLIIGSANYDVGHVVDASTQNSGLAATGVCDNTAKASAATTSVRPIGDAFDVDYLAHELGHQFSGSHTQNNDCNRDPLTSVEPGSGSTIIAYAGICAPNVQNNSGPYFHGITLQQIGAFTQFTATCSVNTPLPNAPTITGSNGNSVIPISTPFALTAFATPGSPGSVLSYDWEQMDKEITVQPPLSNATGGPNFRSFNPATLATRYFPNLQTLANNGPFTWEVLPDVARTMNFRVTVRSNTQGGGCNAYSDFTVTTNAAAGPFRVTYPDAAGIIWQANAQTTVTWDVANTDRGLVNTPFVDIYLSTDGGRTYPTLLAQRVENNGSRTITVPDVSTSTARIMVISTAGTFFNISSNNFSINNSMTITPQLTQATRNPMDLTTAYVYFTGIPSSLFNSTFQLNGLDGAQLTIDSVNNRFVISQITTPRSVRISVTIRITGVNFTTNEITIPGILNGKK